MTASLTRNSIARLAADTSNLALGLITSVVVARWLGAGGKGILSSVSYLAGLIISIALLGLAEAQIVLVGQRRASAEQAYSSTATASLVLGSVGGLILWGAGAIQFHRDWSTAAIPIAITACVVPMSALTQVSTSILNAREKIVRSSLLLLTSATSLLVFTVVMVVLLRWGLIGAMTAAAGSVMVTSIAGVMAVRQMGVRWSASYDVGYLRSAARLGMHLQLATIFVGVASRFDQLLVYTFSGASDAGIYSVALTYGSLSFLPPFALAYATFPRLSGLSAEEGAVLTAKGARLAVVITLLTAFPLAAIAPFIIRTVYGPSFGPGAAPAAILLAGSVILAAQYFLARGRAAQGNPRLLLESFAITAVVMVVLDCIFIPRFGLMAAALASAAGNAAGLVRCVCASGWPDRRLTLLMPRRAELRDAARSLQRVLRGA